MNLNDIPSEVRNRVQRGMVIPAHPLALNGARRLDGVQRHFAHRIVAARVSSRQVERPARHAWRGLGQCHRQREFDTPDLRPLHVARLEKDDPRSGIGAEIDLRLDEIAVAAEPGARTARNRSFLRCARRNSNGSLLLSAASSSINDSRAKTFAVAARTR